MIITKEQSDELKDILENVAYKTLQDPYYNTQEAHAKIIKLFALLKPEDAALIGSYLQCSACKVIKVWDADKLGWFCRTEGCKRQGLTQHQGW